MQVLEIRWFNNRPWFTIRTYPDGRAVIDMGPGGDRLRFDWLEESGAWRFGHLGEMVYRLANDALRSPAVGFARAVAAPLPAPRVPAAELPCMGARCACKHARMDHRKGDGSGPCSRSECACKGFEQAVFAIAELGVA